MLREFSTRESKIAELKVSYDTSCTDNKLQGTATEQESAELLSKQANIV